MPRSTKERSLAPDRSTTVMLILDLISDFRFPQGRNLFRAARPVARNIAKLKARAGVAGVPVIYVNDNFGRWRSDLPAVLRHCSRSGAAGAYMVEMLAPATRDHFILKPRHSGFYATALDTLLEYIGARHLVITGLSASQCVLFTANDAHVRDFRLTIPRDCIASPTAAETRLAIRYFTTVLGADARTSARVRLTRR